ncbi:hypothetical protein B0H10DRAFT_1958019 [Mycena sp. CBHHK59/15]|nr:hypothetical protein B0H10DRAFT_1958019 [Mycena sp. CBHHK59/15]
MPLEFDSPMLDAPLVTPHGETQPDPNPNKRHAVSGPGRNQFENTKAAEDFHKEQAMLARQAVKTKQQEIVQLRVALNAAESEAWVRQQAVAELQNKCEQMAHHLQQNQAHETAIEDQLMQDQSEIAAWASASDPSVRPEHRSYTEMSKQLHDSQKLLTEQNSRMDRLQVAMTDQNYQVERLQRSLVERTDEAIHLRAQVHIGSTPRPRAARRRRQMNMTAVMDFPPTTLEIPLDPAPLPPTSSATPSTGSSGGTSAGDPTIQTMMKMLSELKTQVNSLTVKTKKSRRSAAKTVEKPLSQSTINSCNAALRDIVKQKFDVAQATDFITHVPATNDETEACEAGEDPPENVWKWDFSNGFQHSRWNQAIIERLLDAALEFDTSRELETVQRDWLRHQLGAQLKRYQENWKRRKPRFLTDGLTLEKQDQADARTVHYVTRRRLESKGGASRHRKFTTRQNTIAITIELKKDSGARDIETWKRLLELITYLGISGMSSEDEDTIESTGQMITIFKVKLCVWRAPEVVDYLGFVDAETKMLKTQDPHRGGPRPGARFPTEVLGTSAPPKGLPECLYDSAWLKDQTRTFRQDLEISKEAFSLFVAATSRMHV